MSEAEFEETPETARGQVLHQTLLAVHALIRRDLRRVEELANEAVDGLPAEEIQAEVKELKRDSLLWRLQVDCLRYCGFVHAHHNAEDTELFGELRELNPAINPVIDKLEADHRRVSDDLDAVEESAHALSADEGVDAREAVVSALRRLGANLFEHLDYEERNIKTTMRRMRELA